MARSGLALAASALAATMMTAMPAASQTIRSGTLTCQVEPGVGLIIGSRKDVTCTFEDAAGNLEIYDGSIAKLGVDIGVTNGGQIVWRVATSSGVTRRGLLTGRYVGGTASATFGGGLGANALVGGSRNSVALQPLSVEGNTGLNIAAGAAELVLRARPEPRRPLR